MIGTGTIVNAAAIIAGGAIGMLSGSLIRDRMRDDTVLEIVETDRKPAQMLYEEYKEMNKIVY